MPEIEIEVVAHVSLRLAGALDDILFCFICASHDRCGSQWIVIVKAAARLIQPLRHRRVRRIVDGLAVDVVEQYDTVAREAEALGERYAHQGADRLTASHDIKILGFIQADVSGRILQHAAHCQICFIGYMQGEWQLVMPPKRRPSLLKSDLSCVCETRNEVAR